jgi:ATP-dependent helicase/nuclease subunit B
MDSFDREARQKGKSELFPIEYKKDGTPAARSGIVSGEDFRTITEYARRKAASCADRIMRGYAAVRPYRTGNESACTWCPYRAVCGFDEKIPGYRYRLFAPMNQVEALIKMREDPDELDG